MEKLTLRGQNFCTTPGALACTGAASTFATTTSINYALNGKLATKTLVTGATTPTTGYSSGAAITLAASQARVIVWGLISGGTVKVLEGPVTTWDGTNYGNGGAPAFPDIPDAFVPFAYQILKTSSTAGTITFGSSNWNATGFTNSIVNVAVLPDRPQTS